MINLKIKRSLDSKWDGLWVVSWADKGIGLVSGVEGVPGIGPFLALNVDEFSVD